MTTQFDDDATTASIDSTHDDDIDVSKAPIVVSWTDEDQARSLSHSPLTHDHVTLDIQFQEESQTAFFKITANLALKGKRTRSNIFLFVPPERIRSLDFVDQDDKSVSASKILGTSTHSLQFALFEPPSLVVPKDDYIPKSETARTTLEALRALARATLLRVDLPSNALAEQRLLALCEKASTGGALNTIPGVANLAKLYGGKGGQIIESRLSETAKVRSDGEPSASAEKASLSASPREDPCGKAPATSEAPAEFPPSYHDLGHSPPSYPPSSKRRRLDSGSQDTRQAGLKIEEICRQGFNEIGRRLDHIEKQLGTLGSRLERVEQRISSMETSSDAQPCSSERSDQGEDGLYQRVGCIEERVTGLEEKLDTGLSELTQNVDEQLEEIRYDFDTTTLIRIEDEMSVTQAQLEEFVRDEVRNVAEEIDDTIRDKLRDALS